MENIVPIVTISDYVKHRIKSQHPIKIDMDYINSLGAFGTHQESNDIIDADYIEVE